MSMAKGLIEFSLPKFPLNATVKEGCALPWGAVVTPFGVDDALKSAKHAVSLGEAVHGAIPAGIARCSGCLAYINSFCSIKTSGAWICLLCGQSNGAESRYSPQQRHLCPEVASNIVEFDVRPPIHSGFSDVDIPDGWPCYLFVISPRGSPEYTAALQNGISAILEALPLNALVGVIIARDASVGLLQLGGGSGLSLSSRDQEPVTLLRNVPFDLGDGATSLNEVDAAASSSSSSSSSSSTPSSSSATPDTVPPLADALSFGELVGRVATIRHVIESSIARIVASTSSSSSSSAAAAATMPMPSAAIPEPSPSTLASSSSALIDDPYAQQQQQPRQTAINIGDLVANNAATSSSASPSPSTPSPSPAAAPSATKYPRCAMTSSIASVLRMVDAWQSNAAANSVAPPSFGSRGTDGNGKEQSGSQFTHVAPDPGPAVRIMYFLEGAIDAGVGQTVTFSHRKASPSAIYATLGRIASDLGVPIDGVHFTNATDAARTIAMVAPMIATSGGALFHYPAASLAQQTAQRQFPQDMHRHWSLSCSFGGLMRLRTSRTFRVGRLFGAVRDDPDHVGIKHVTRAFRHTAFPVFFEYDAFASFEDASSRNGTPFYPAMQLAYVYSSFVRVPYRPSSAPSSPSASSASTDPEEDPIEGHVGILVRRLRIVTVCATIVPTPIECVGAANPDVIITLLAAKLIADHLDGLSNATGAAPPSTHLKQQRALIVDWLSNFASRASRLLEDEAGKQISQSARGIVTRMNKNDATRRICTLIFALASSPLLSENVAMDEQTRIALLFRHLPPWLLCRFLYPLAIGFSDADHTTEPAVLALSRSSVVLANPALVLVDCGAACITYVAISTAMNADRPNPHTQLGSAVEDARSQDRPMAVQSIVVRAGTPSAGVFDALLIEDASVEKGTPSFAAFMAAVGEDAATAVAEIR